MFGKQLGRRFAMALAAAAVAVVIPARAAGPVPLYEAMIKAHPAPALEQVEGREYKFLIDPAQTRPKVEEAFVDIWQQVLLASERRGFKVTQKNKDPFKVEFSTKEYFDTTDQALWKAGYLVRISTRYSGEQSEPTVSVTVKSINRDIAAVLARPLTVVGVDKSKTEAEDGVGFVPGGKLGQYVEKGSSFSVPAAALGARTLGDFGKYVPELLKLGIPAGTRLVGITAYSYRVKPGAIVLPDVGPCGVSMEAWSKTKGGAPYLYDFSFAYGDVDFYAVGEAHAVGERFLEAVFGDQLYRLQPADGEKWGGSKVRYLMNRPL
jgi:hypothetical protein